MSASIDISFPESEFSPSLVDESQEKWVLEAIKNGVVTDTYNLDHFEFEDQTISGYGRDSNDEIFYIKGNEEENNVYAVTFQGSLKKLSSDATIEEEGDVFRGELFKISKLANPNDD